MSDPTIKELALASESAYSDTAPDGYSRVDEYSSPDISTYKHNENPHYIVSHRGTDMSAKKKNKQIVADLNILVGNRNQDKLHKERARRTEDIVKGIKEKDPSHDIFMTGHSLGGSTAHHAMIKSATVRDNVKELHTFNAGSSPLQAKGLAKSNKAYKTIADKSTHHAIQGDAISESIRSNLIGTHKIYKKPPKKASVGRTILTLAKPHLEKSALGKLVHFGASRLLDTFESHSLKNFT
jgi:hypothetical protein